MNFAMEATFPPGVLLGTRGVHREVTDQEFVLVLSGDNALAVDLIKRAVGEKAAQRHFAYNVEDADRWFRETSVTGNGEVQQFIDTLVSTQRQLGSVRITGAVLRFKWSQLANFWIETAEGDRVRVLTGESEEGGREFYPYGPNWQFRPVDIASAIFAHH